MAHVLPLAVVRRFPGAGGPVELALRPGEVVRLAGPNGSGKTSLLRALAGLEAPIGAKDVLVGGTDPRRLPAARRRLAAALLMEDPRDTLVGLTVAGEHRLRGHAAPAALGHREVATLSSGEARRVGLRLVAREEASLLLLDEPSEGLDAAAREELAAIVRAWPGAVVFADHGGLGGLEDRVVDLGRPAPPPLPRVPRPGGPPVLEAPASQAVRGTRRLDLPAVRLPAGLHAVTGANGSGKTSLLRRLAGLEDSAGVRVAGAEPGPRTARFLPARAREIFTRPTVAEELGGCASPLVPARLMDRHPLCLSGGEARRVALAKVLGRPAPAYLLDEPEAHLDPDGRQALLAAVAGRVQEGACVVAATHDAAMADAAASVTVIPGGSA